MIESFLLPVKPVTYINKKLKKCLTDRTTCDKISTVAAEKAAHRTLTNKQ